MRTKKERLATIRLMLNTLKLRKRDAVSEIAVLNSAITFYEQMKILVRKEKSK